MESSPTVLITGASSGIGKITAHTLQAHGCRVFGTSRSPQRQGLLPYPLLPLDVQSPQSIEACLSMLLEQAGRLDVLVNNAGYLGPLAASEEMSIEQLRALFETNFFGLVQVTNAILPLFRRQGYGQIINISSLAGLVGMPPFTTAYTASKHALEGYTEALRMELEPLKIAVSLVEPGYINTGFSSTVQAPAKPLPVYASRRQNVARVELAAIELGRNPERVAHAVWNLIRSPHPPLRTLVGLDAHVTAAFARLAPTALVHAFVNWLFGNREGICISPARLSYRRRFWLDSRLINRNLKIVALCTAIGTVTGILLGRKKR